MSSYDISFSDDPRPEMNRGFAECRWELLRWGIRWCMSGGGRGVAGGLFGGREGSGGSEIVFFWVFWGVRKWGFSRFLRVKKSEKNVKKRQILGKKSAILEGL